MQLFSYFVVIGTDAVHLGGPFQVQVNWLWCSVLKGEADILTVLGEDGGAGCDLGVLEHGSGGLDFAIVHH